MEISSLVSATLRYMQWNFFAANSTAEVFASWRMKVSTTPSAANRVATVLNVAGNARVWVSLNSTGTLQLSDEDGNIGSVTTAINDGNWHMVQLRVIATTASATVEMLLDGSVVATASNRALSSGIGRLRLGGNLNTEAQTTGVWYFDTVVINDTSGSNMTTLPTTGIKTATLKPNAVGDNETWARTGAGLTNNYQAVSETPPDGNTTVVACGSNAVGDIDDYNIDTTPSDLYGSPDNPSTVHAVAVRARYNGSTATSPYDRFVTRLKAASGGTVTESADTVSASTAYITDLDSIITYTKPGGGAWTKADLDQAQVGLRKTIDNTTGQRVTVIDALVIYEGGSAAAPGADTGDFFAYI